jgi:hypothetical protein
MSTSWVAEIVFESSKYKLIKYYYSENEGAFEITDGGITNKKGSFKYENVAPQSGGNISFNDGQNTSSTYTNLFFVIYDGSTEFADNNMKVHECTSDKDNGSYTYDGLKGNSLTSIKFTNMKADRSELNAITSVVAPETKAPTVVQETPQKSVEAPETKQQAQAPAAAAPETIPDEVKNFNGVTLRNNKGTIQVYIPNGYSISKYDIFFNKPISAATYHEDRRGSPLDAGYFDLSINKNNKKHVFIDLGRNTTYEHKPIFQDMFHIKDNNNSLLINAKIMDNSDTKFARIVYGGIEVPSQTITL